MTKFMIRAVAISLAIMGALGVLLDPTNPAGGLTLLFSALLFVAGYEKRKDGVQ